MIALALAVALVAAPSTDRERLFARLQETHGLDAASLAHARAALSDGAGDPRRAWVVSSHESLAWSRSVIDLGE